MEYSRHRQLVALETETPLIGPKSFLAPNATLSKFLWPLVGDVLVSGKCGIGYDTILKGEYQPIRIGEFSNIGDLCTITSFSSPGVTVPASVNIGKNVVIGNKCYICSSIIDDDCIIGNNCSIMEGSRLERGCVIAPNSVVPPGSLISAGQLWGGSPVTYIRDLDKKESLENYKRSYKYVDNSQKHLEQIAAPIKELEDEDRNSVYGTLSSSKTKIIIDKEANSPSKNTPSI